MPYKDKEAQRKYQREWQSKRRAEYLADKACVICGSAENLEVDHIDRTKKVSHRIWSWSAKRRDEELAKCQILCEDHHLEKSIEEMNGVEIHGHSRYAKHGCRCKVCTTDHARVNREWRQNRAVR